jgi:hypothetical protein
MAEDFGNSIGVDDQPKADIAKLVKINHDGLRTTLDTAGRRVVVSAALGLVCAFALIGCGGSSKVSEPPGKDSPATEISTTTTTSKEVTLTPEGVAQMLSESGLGCADFDAKVVDPSRPKTTIVPEPSSVSGSCKSDGTSLTVTVFENKADVEMASAQVKTIYASVAKSLGITQLTYVHAGKDNRIWVSIGKESGGDKGLTPQQEELLRNISKVLGGKVVKYDL